MLSHEPQSVNYMKKRINIYILYLIGIVGCLLVSCSHEEEPDVPKTQHTVFMYFPWSSNLTDCFYQNIRDMEACICQMGGLANDRLVVFMSTSPTEASLYEIVYDNGKCRHVPIETYADYPFTTEHGLTNLLQDVVSYAPATRYSMIIGCHGMGWLPAATSRTGYSTEKYHYEYGNGALMTRYFGGLTTNYQTDISTLADALSNAGLKMEYILFDDCYMASVEVAYELKDVTGHLIASTCEVMAYGMPYATIGRYLLGTPDYRAVCDEFYKFYSGYSVMPCGTLSVTDCSQMDEMAALMRHINASYSFDKGSLSALQRLDGYSPTIFFDYGDYVTKLLESNQADEGLVSTFRRQLERTVPYRVNTEKYYTASRGPLPINTYSGITISDPSVSTKAIDKVKTKWYKATH